MSMHSAHAQGSPERFAYVYPYEEGELKAEMGETAAPVVLEFFSSQACVFCPMADKFMQDLRADAENLIILACHVDYFDVAKGSIATPECSARQRDYVRRINGATLYTPQVIINGQYDYVGYEFDMFMERVVESAKMQNVKPVSIAPIEGESGLSKKFEAELLPVASLEEGRQDYDVLLYFLDKDHNIEVAEGANKGKNIPYINIVQYSEKLGSWDGTAQKISFTIDISAQHKSAVVLVKSQRGHIIAAGQFAL